MTRAPRSSERRLVSVGAFSRAARLARASLACGRALEAVALAGGGAALAAALAQAVVPSSSPFAAAASGIALLLVRGRGVAPSLEEAARALDRRFGTGEIASSALAAAPESGVGRLCIARACAAFPPRLGFLLAVPSLRGLAAPALAGCLALAAFALGPERASPPPQWSDLALVEEFAREVAGRGAAGAAPIAQRARSLRRDLAAEGAAGGTLREELRRLAAEARELATAHSAGESGSGGRAGSAQARAAAVRLAAFAGEGEAGETGIASRSSSGAAPAAPPSVAPESPEPVGGSDRSAGPDSVPLRYKAVVARYFSRER